MNAMPPTFTGAPLAHALHDDAVVTERWHALLEAGRLIASLAGTEPAWTMADHGDLPNRIRAADPWRRERAEHGLADLAAVMEPGIAALLAIRDRGADARPAAQALWHEFAAARGALFALTSPPQN